MAVGLVDILALVRTVPAIALRHPFMSSLVWLSGCLGSGTVALLCTERLPAVQPASKRAAVRLPAPAFLAYRDVVRYLH